MLSSLSRLGRKTLVFPSSRTFATSLLEQCPLLQLQNEARRHGISPSGNKATLITRIKHVEISENNAGRAISIHSRDSSTVDHGTSSPASPSFTGSTLNVKLPDLSTPQELPRPHIPFLPDFWDSSRLRGADAIRHDAEAEAPMRKVLVVGGTSTQHAGGPTYGESDHTEFESGEGKFSRGAPLTPALGFWADVIEDIGLPPSFDPSVPLTKAHKVIVSVFQDSAPQTQKPTFQQRPLDPDEAKGVWVLLLILAGSWLAGGLFDGSKGRSPPKP